MKGIPKNLLYLNFRIRNCRAISQLQMPPFAWVPVCISMYAVAVCISMYAVAVYGHKD